MLGWEEGPKTVGDEPLLWAWIHLANREYWFKASFANNSRHRLGHGALKGSSSPSLGVAMWSFLGFDVPVNQMGMFPFSWVNKTVFGRWQCSKSLQKWDLMRVSVISFTFDQNWFLYKPLFFRWTFPLCLSVSYLLRCVSCTLECLQVFMLRWDWLPSGKAQCLGHEGKLGWVAQTEASISFSLKSKQMNASKPHRPRLSCSGRFQFLWCCLNRRNFLSPCWPTEMPGVK